MRYLAILVQIVAVLTLAVVFAGFFGKWNYLLDLCSHFRVQAALALVLCGLFLLLLKRRRWATSSLIAGLGLTATLWPFYVPGSAETIGKYRLLTVNVLSYNPRHDRVIDFIRETDPDFIVLQETDESWIESLDAALRESWPYSKSISRLDNFGIAIYSKLPWVRCDLVNFTPTSPTPAYDALFELPDGSELRLITVHPVSPLGYNRWLSRNSFFAGLAGDVSKVGKNRTIVAGDFNCTPWSYWFGRLLAESGLRNASDGQGFRVTWMPVPIPILGLPIDHVLVGPDIQVSNRNVGPYVGSDHRPVVVDFD